MQLEGKIYGTFEQYGAPNSFSSDKTKYENGKAVCDIQLMYDMKAFQWEPHHQLEYFRECNIQEVKKLSNTLFRSLYGFHVYKMLYTYSTVYPLKPFGVKHLLREIMDNIWMILLLWSSNGFILCILTPPYHLSDKNV
jgi:hypothetical protein